MSAHQSQPSEQRNQGGSSGWLQGIVITVVGGILASLGWFYVQNWMTPTDGRGPSTSAPSRSQPPTRPEEAAIFLDKLSGPVQTAVGVSGEGFEPNEQVVIRFHAEECARTRASQSGTFSRVTCRIPADWKFEGSFEIIATGTKSLHFASAQFRVT
mgnify:FL=1